MPHIVLQTSGYACVVYLIIPQLFSETASFYTESDKTKVCQRERVGRRGEPVFLSHLEEKKLG